MLALWIVLILIVVLLVVLMARATAFKKVLVASTPQKDIMVSEDKIIQDMVDIIRCKTVSNRDETLVDRAEFEKLHTLIQERFPLLHHNCPPEHIGKTGLLFTWKGKSSKAPKVLMAHYDVVPVNPDLWSKPAFEGIIENNVLWGRGTLDTKGTFLSILEAVEQKMDEGFIPENDLYLSFSGEEEIDGNTCAVIVETLEKRGIKPAFVLDEGGAVVEHVFPGVETDCALIGIGEKGSLNIDIEIDGQGGHASGPPKHTGIGQLAQAAVSIEDHPFKTQFTPPVLKMFETLGPYSSFGYRLIFANLWLFKPLLAHLFRSSGGEMNAMIATTCALTRMSGSKAYNVLPPSATLGANLRLLGDDTVDRSIARLNHLINNPDINIKIVNGMNPSIYSDTDCSEYELLKEVIHETWPDTLVSPYLMMACSDSRHYCRITDRVYRFSAMKLSKEEREMIHGNDERIPIETLIKTVKFYVRLIDRL